MTTPSNRHPATDAPLHVKLSLRAIEPMRAVRYKDFAYWDNASESFDDTLGTGASTPIVIESMVLGHAPALDLRGGYTGRRTAVLGRAQPSPYRELTLTLRESKRGLSIPVFRSWR